MQARHVSVLLASLLLSAPALAEEPAAGGDQGEKNNPFANIKFQDGPVDGKLENIASIKVPQGVSFVSGRVESKKFIEATQNLVSNQEVGILVPNVEGEMWWIDFEFDPSGYVKDDEKDNLDADAILESLKKGTEEGNAQRRARGWDDLHVVGWHTPPKYNPTTHNLEWATRLSSKSGENVNYSVRILGRRGVMSVTLIAGQENLEPMIAKMQTMLAGFAYLPDEAYSAFKPGDKVAEYGLTALVAGGVIAVAAKSGLLAKFWKLIVAAFVALGAGIKRLFGGRKKSEPPMAQYTPPPPPPGGPPPGV